MSTITVTSTVSARIPKEYGEFELVYYNNAFDDKEHLAFCMGDLSSGENVLIRNHSQCLTGDIFGSLTCDCGEQLRAEYGRGLIVYLSQEGRGIGSQQKIHAYNLQDAGHDTVDANLKHGHKADECEYTVAVRILEDFGINSVRLITNNPLKISSWEDAGIEVSERVELDNFVNPEKSQYLPTKAERMNHPLPMANFPPVN